MIKPKVIFTFVEAGLGHIVPATAVSEAFTKKYGKLCEVINWHIFSDSKNEKIRNYAKKLIDWAKTVSDNPFVKNFEKFSYSLSSDFTLKVLDAKFKKEKLLIMEEINEMNPDLIFSTYYSPSHFAIESRKKYNNDFIVATYTPDPIIYPAWDRRGDLYFVNNEQAKEIAYKQKFKENSVKQVPFVLRKEIINADRNKTNVRKYLTLPNKFTILISSGAYGAKRDEKIIKTILNKDWDINLIVLCGKNEELLKKYSQLQNSNDTKINFIPVGFTTEMSKYIVASDIMLGKSGGNNLAEAFYLGTPLIVTNHANYLEKKISDYFIDKKHYGLKISNVKDIISKIEDLYSGKIDFEHIKENAKEMQDSTGAEKMADELFNKLKEKFNLKERED